MDPAPTPHNESLLVTWMNWAISEAEKAEQHGDVPVGAVVVRDGECISSAHNERELRKSPTAHAEVLAIEAAAKQLGTWRLSGATLVVTLEPCVMCAGAAVLSRVDRVIYGATDPKAGALASLYQIGEDVRLNHRFEVIGGIEAERCGELLRRFFASRRG